MFKQERFGNILINAHLVAMSSDGRYVLYQKMESDALVGKELWAFDLLEKEQENPVRPDPGRFYL